MGWESQSQLFKTGALQFCRAEQNHLYETISDAINDIIRKEQAGFRPGVGCIDHILTFRNIIEQSIEWKSRVHIHFIDLDKTFDRIHRESLWKILKAYGCPEKLIDIIKHFMQCHT